MRRTFLLGVGINLTNPKVVLFFVTFLPQFVAADDPHAMQKLFFLGFFFVIIAAPICAATPAAPPATPRQCAPRPRRRRQSQERRAR